MVTATITAPAVPVEPTHIPSDPEFEGWPNDRHYDADIHDPDCMCCACGYAAESDAEAFWRGWDR